LSGLTQSSSLLVCLSDLEIISQPDPVEEHGVQEMNSSCMAPVQLVSFGYRDLPLAHLDLSLAGSQLLSNLDEDDNREGLVFLSCGGPHESQFHSSCLLPSPPLYTTATLSYVLQVKVEMELEILQCEKIKAVREEQLERLTQICQEQAFEIRQLRAHLAQQDLDLAAEQEAAMQIHHVWGKQRSTNCAPRLRLAATEPGLEPGANPVVHHDDMNNYISQYYSEQSSDMGGPRVITTAAIDVHLPTTHYPAHNNPLLGVEQMSSAVSDTSTSVSLSSSSLTARPHSLSSHTLRSSTTDCSSTTARDYHTQRCFPLPYCSPLGLGLTSPPLPRDPSVVVQELLSSLSEDSCLAQKGLVDPVNLKLPSPAGSAKASPELEHRINIYNWKNQEENQYQSRGQRQGRAAATVLLQTKPLIHLQGGSPESSLEEKYRLLGPADGPLGRLPDT
uniref:Transmembrane protein 266 n=1 Tax=Oncorhynchus kisutch TaxID=8019 RepID=A0A8C7F7S5_ONCKI